MIIDTHSHLNFKAFDQDRDQIIKQCQEKDIVAVNVGTSLITSKKAVDIAQKNKNMWASVGLHPIHLASKIMKLQDDENEENPNDEPEFDSQAYKELARNPKVVAIGEIGLDYYYKPKNTGKKLLFKQDQQELFKKELELAKELDKAVIIHCRMAYDDMIDFFNNNPGLIPKRAVLHCFMADLVYLNRFLDLGFFIGYNGIIFKQIPGINFEELIKTTPDQRIVLETDCPYLIHPSKKGERNTPMGVLDVLNEIARIKQKDPNELAEIYNNNAKELFQIEF